jgi:hypothetical protein
MKKPFVVLLVLVVLSLFMTTPAEAGRVRVHRYHRWHHRHHHHHHYRHHHHAVFVIR